MLRTVMESLLLSDLPGEAATAPLMTEFLNSLSLFSRAVGAAVP
jgi:hypothetical protein